MFILYLDESGNNSEASCFVLAGLAVFEREIYWFGQDLDSLQKEYFPTERDSILFHATKMRVADNQNVDPPWNSLTQEKRRQLKDRVYDSIRARRAVLFGCVVDQKFASNRNVDAYERAFEDIINRFDLFLARINAQAEKEGREEQRGLIVLAESSFEKTISLLAHRIRVQGTRWGQLRNMSDVPFFAPAKDTRLLQYADFCANALYGRYHASLARDFDRIALKFDQEGNSLHGLNHLTLDGMCACIACFSRRGRQFSITSQPILPH